MFSYINYYLLRSGHKEFFPYWDEQNAVSIGFHTEAEKVVDGASWDETRRRIADKYSTETPGDATGEIFCFADREGKSRPPMSEDDIVIVIGKKDIKGEPVVRAVAKVGEVDVREEPVDDDYKHTVYRPVKEWKYNGGPVARKELDERFHIGGEGSTWFRGTLKQWKPDRENNSNINSLIGDLIKQLHSAPNMQPKEYEFEYKERVIQQHISDHPEEFGESTEIDPDTLDSEHVTEGRRRADFLALEEGDSVIIVETKTDTAGTRAVNQLNIEEDYQEDVRGILVAEDFVAYEDIKENIGDYNIELKRYSVTLEYETVDL